MMGILLMDFQTLQKPVQLPVINLAYLFLVFRPSEKLLFQAFVPKAEPIPVPIKYFNHIPAFVAKRKQMTGQRILFYVLRIQHRQSVDGFAHICVPDCQKHPDMEWKKHYNRSRE